MNLANKAEILFSGGKGDFLVNYYQIMHKKITPLIKMDAHKEVFAIALMIFSQKCYDVSIDNVTALMYNYY
ncbi:MAG: hypothetical protein K2J32_11165 [Ruminococcus sp.]|nr:hypothetical protein [Ruminococcus sp.]